MPYVHPQHINNNNNKKGNQICKNNMYLMLAQDPPLKAHLIKLQISLCRNFITGEPADGQP